MMKRPVILLLIGSLATPAFAQTAGMIGFQGLIKDAGGVPLPPVSIDLYFCIYDQSTGGACVAGPFGPVAVTPVNGVVSTKFGPIAATAFDGTRRWLEVRIDDGGGPFPLSRIELATAPAVAEQVNIPATGDPAIRVDASGDVLLVPDGSGNVGIGTTNPLRRLHLEVTDLHLDATAVGGFERLIVESTGAGVGLFSDGAGTFGSVLSLAEVDGAGLLVDKWSLIRQTNALGAGLQLRYGTDAGASNNAPLVHFGSNGNVGIGTTSPKSALHVVGGVINLDQYAGSTGFIGRRANGTSATPTALQSGDVLSTFGAKGYGTSGFSSATRGNMQVIAAQDWTDTAQGTDVRFLTTANNSTTTAERMRIDDNGNVGIGQTSPEAPLHLTGSPDVNASGGGALVVGDTVGSNKFNLAIDQNEIGAHASDAAGVFGPSGMILNGNGGDVTVGDANSVVTVRGSIKRPGQGTILFNGTPSGTPGADGFRVRWDEAFPGGDALVFEKTDGNAPDPDGAIAFVNTGNDGIVETALMIDGSGRVGIGTTDPRLPLHVKGNGGSVALEGANHTFIEFYPDGVAAGRKGYLGYPSANNDHITIHNEIPDGNIRLATTGAGRVSVPVLEITGADVAEKFPVSSTVEPGMVVEIDPDHPGKLRVARGAYNRRVAGVVSGAGGLATGAILGNLPGSDDAPPIALSGRVWVHCDASGGAIEPGDLLTTSDTLGHAMKVTDYGKAQGAAIGKAMTRLGESEKGLVLVLVNLQ